MPDAALPASAAPRSRPAHPPELMLAAGLSLGCALIHLQAAVDHLGESRLYAGLFVLLAAGQAAWAGAVIRRPSRRMVLAGVLGSLGVIAAWTVSRTLGLPVGPDTAGPEAAGLLDVMATLDELATIGLLLVLRRASPAPDADGEPLRRLVLGLGLILALCSSLVLAGGVHAH